MFIKTPFFIVLLLLCSISQAHSVVDAIQASDVDMVTALWQEHTISGEDLKLYQQIADEVVTLRREQLVAGGSFPIANLSDLNSSHYAFMVLALAGYLHGDSYKRGICGEINYIVYPFNVSTCSFFLLAVCVKWLADSAHRQRQKLYHDAMAIKCLVNE